MTKAQDAQDRQAVIDDEARAEAVFQHTQAREAEQTAAATTDYEGKQHYPKVRYHQTEAPRRVQDATEEAALEAACPGWLDTPSVAPEPEAPPAVPDLPGVKA